MSGANVGNFGNFNQFEGMGGNDTIIGNGNTRIVFGSANSGVTVNLATGTSSGTLANDVAKVGTDSFTGVNSVIGSGFDDIITGNSASNILNGGSGNDTIDGGGGTDLAVFSGAIAGYLISFDTPSAGQIRVADQTSGRDGTDTLSNVEVLQFSDTTVLVASGTQAVPVDLGVLTQGIVLNPVTTLTGNANDFVVVNTNINGLSINLGGGTGDTVTLSAAGSYSLNLFNVESVAGTTGNDTVGLVNNANGLFVDLGGGTDTLILARGNNTLGVSNVETINGSDFGGANPRTTR